MKYAFLLFLASCVHVHTFTWPDGEVDYSIDCEAKAHDPTGVCWRKAHSLCKGSKVKLLNRDDSGKYLRITCMEK